MVLEARAGYHDASKRPFRRRLSQWLNRIRPEYVSKHKLSVPPEPLPLLRRQISARSRVSSTYLQQDSQFFTHLPPELRHDILLHAFGDKTMHIHLGFDHPTLGPAEKGQGGGSAHAEINYRRNLSAPRQWLWSSSVCHRNIPWCIQSNVWWRMNWQTPELDRCMEGHGAYCRLWLGQWPGKCRIGVMGWLLSCRRAYNEAINLLYMTNTFHISGEGLMRRLPDYIVPNRLAQMSSFEIILSLSGNTNETPIIPSTQTLSLLLAMLGKHTNIKRLYLSLTWPEILRRVVNVDLQPILNAIDTFIRTTQTECVMIQFNSAALRQLHESISGLPTHPSELERVQQSHDSLRIWRSVDSDDAKDYTIVYRQCSIPQRSAPLIDPARPELGPSQGYWVFRAEDYWRQGMVANCF